MSAPRGSTTTGHLPVMLGEVLAALGPRIGYKVAFTGKASQESSGINEPARGVLIGDMLIAGRDKVAA